MVLSSLPNLLFSTNLFDATSAWNSEAAMPYKLQEIYCGVLKNKIHVAGGFLNENGVMGVSSHHVVFNTKNSKWSSKASLPSPRHHPQLIGHKGILYAFGGFEVGQPNQIWMMRQQSWIYDAKNDSWSSLKDAPIKNAEVVSASLGNHIHIVGGRVPHGAKNESYGDHMDTVSHQIFDPESNSWSTAAPALKARNSAAGAIIDDSFYVVGGRTVKGGNIGDLEIYDKKEDKWRTGTPMPQGQGGLAAASLNGKLYAFGGEYFNNGGGVYKECWCYNPSKDNWTASTPMLTPRHGLCAARVENKIYAIGGAKKSSGRETSNIVESIQFD